MTTISMTQKFNNDINFMQRVARVHVVEWWYELSAEHSQSSCLLAASACPLITSDMLRHAGREELKWIEVSASNSLVFN